MPGDGCDAILGKGLPVLLTRGAVTDEELDVCEGDRVDHVLLHVPPCPQRAPVESRARVVLQHDHVPLKDVLREGVAVMPLARHVRDDVRRHLHDCLDVAQLCEVVTTPRAVHVVALVAEVVSTLATRGALV